LGGLYLDRGEKSVSEETLRGGGGGRLGRIRELKRGKEGLKGYRKPRKWGRGLGKKSKPAGGGKHVSMERKNAIKGGEKIRSRKDMEKCPNISTSC